jgi:hypothetical protein
VVANLGNHKGLPLINFPNRVFSGDNEMI